MKVCTATKDIKKQMENIQTAYYMVHALIYKSHTTETIVERRSLAIIPLNIIVLMHGHQLYHRSQLIVH